MNDIEKIVNNIFNEIKGLSDETEISISELIKKLNLSLDFSTEDMFEIEKKVREKAETEGIVLDKSKYDGAVVGFSFNIPFVKRKSNS